MDQNGDGYARRSRRIDATLTLCILCELMGTGWRVRSEQVALSRSERAVSRVFFVDKSPVTMHALMVP